MQTTYPTKFSTTIYSPLTSCSTSFVTTSSFIRSSLYSISQYALASSKQPMSGSLLSAVISAQAIPYADNTEENLGITTVLMPRPFAMAAACWPPCTRKRFNRGLDVSQAKPDLQLPQNSTDRALMVRSLSVALQFASAATSLHLFDSRVNIKCLHRRAVKDLLATLIKPAATWSRVYAD